jgi:hypothetical protein
VFQTRPRIRKLETQRHREHGESPLVFFNSVFFSAPLCLCVLNPTAHPVIGNTESQRTRREPPGFLQFCFFLCASESLCFKPDRAPGNWKHRVTENTERARWFSSILFFSLRLCVSVFQSRPRTRKLEAQSHREHGESPLVFFNSVFFSAPLCLCVSNPTAHLVIGNTESQRTRREPEASDRSEISVGLGPVARFL